jgi:arylsulfatase A-like enzyme
MPEDLTIPWFMVGPKVRSGYEIKAPVSLLDTAPTIARLLNVQPPTEWVGRAIEEALL